jgi:hypothetical protein
MVSPLIHPLLTIIVNNVLIIYQLLCLVMIIG